MATAESFDPYYTWLGIPKDEQPADHYRLLGLRRFEDNSDAIANASDQRMDFVRRMAQGKRAAETQKLLNELSLATHCLLDEAKKREYDASLRKPHLPAVVVDAAPRTLAARTSAATTARPTAARRPIPLAAIVIGAVAGLVVGTIALWAMNREPKPTVAAQPRPVRPAFAPKPTPPEAPKDLGPIAPAIPGSAATPTEPASPLEPTTVPATPAPAVPSNAGKPAAAPSAALPTATPNGALQALRFQGQGQVELTGTKGLLDLRKPFTVELWVRPAPGIVNAWLTGDCVFGANTLGVPATRASGWQLWLMRAPNGRLRIAVNTGQGFSTDFPEGSAWHHVAFCGDGEKHTLFVDGRPLVSHAVDFLATSWLPSPLALHVGGHPHLNPGDQPARLRGDVRGVRIASATCRYSSPFTPSHPFIRDAASKVFLDFRSGSDGTMTEAVSNRALATTGAQWIPESAPAPEPVPLVIAVKTTAVVAPPATPPANAPNAPATPSAAPTVVPPAEPDAPKGKHPAPKTAEFDAALANVRNVYRDEIAKATKPADQTKLAEQLLQTARESRETPATAFVLYGLAQDLALQSGRLSQSLAINDELAEQFEVDAWSRRMELFQRATEAAKLPDDRHRVAEAGLALVQQAIRDGQFDRGVELLRSTQTIVVRLKDSELGLAVRQQSAELDEVRRGNAAAIAARDKLKQTPDDPAAQLTLGRHLCLQQRDWEAGLPHLAKGGDNDLGRVARRDLKRPADPAQEVELADEWWNLAQQNKGRANTSLLLRAAHWYRQALTKANGLPKVQAERRLAEFDKLVAKHHRETTAAPAPAAVQPNVPREFRGLVGRVTVDGQDATLLVRYQEGFGIGNNQVTDLLLRAGAPRGAVRLDFVGYVHTNEPQAVLIRHRGGSDQALHTLYVDGRKIGEIGGANRPKDDAYKLDLTAGRHTVRWVLTGGDIGTSALQISDAMTSAVLPFFHDLQLLTQARVPPTRLNVDMFRNQ